MFVYDNSRAVNCLSIHQFIEMVDLCGNWSTLKIAQCGLRNKREREGERVYGVMVACTLFHQPTHLYNGYLVFVLTVSH